MSSLTKGGRNIIASRDLRRVFFPSSLPEEQQQVKPKRNRATRRSPAKEEADEYEDTEGAFLEIPEERKEADNTFEDGNDHKSPDYSDEASFNENDYSSDDSDYEEKQEKEEKQLGQSEVASWKGKRGGYRDDEQNAIKR